MNKVCYFSLLAEEEKHRLAEQSALLASISENGSTGRSKLSALRRAGLAMTGLEVSGRSSGSGGRILLELVSGIAKAASEAGGCCFRAGELVRIVIGGRVLDSIGTVERRNSNVNCVTISLSNDVESEELELISSSRLALIKIVDDIGMFDKMRDNLKQILDSAEDSVGIISEMKRFLTTDFTSPLEKDDLKLSKNNSCSPNSKFNLEQEMAIGRALKMISGDEEGDNLLLIHGPPGTGKTSVLVEIIKRARLEKKALKILICGPSNLSVDNVVERLLKDGHDSMSIVRIGHPARVLESCQRSTLDFWCENSDEGRLLVDVESEIERILKIDLPRCKSREERGACFGELKLLRRERKKRIKELERTLIGRAGIVACTLSTACGKKLKAFGRGYFDFAIVDEAGQSLLPEILVAPLKAKKLILVGDHFQLPPTVMCPEIKTRLQVSLFEHLNNTTFNTAKSKLSKVMLKEQYRMNERIMEWSNKEFYGGELRANESVAKWRIPQVDDELGDVLIFYDTCGFDLFEDTETDDSKTGKGIIVEESSKYNAGEAKIVLDHLRKSRSLLDARLGLSIAVISPYSAQVNFIKDALLESPDTIDASRIEVNSIDGFQGREKDVVILSLVRSNGEGVVGFLNEMRRLNVAMTRAKKQLVVIGDSGTLSRDEKLKSLVEYLNENGTIMFPE